MTDNLKVLFYMLPKRNNKAEEKKMFIIEFKIFVS